MTALQSADAAFAAGPPFERGSNGARAPVPALPRQDHRAHSAVVRDLLIRPGGKTPIGHGQARWPPEELLVSDERGFPQRLIRHPGHTDRVVGDELSLGLLNLDELAELGELGRLALPNGFGVGLEEAEELSR